MMLIPDANLLVYAINRNNPDHRDSFAWLRRTLQGSAQTGFCAPVVFAFVRIASNPKIVPHPLTVDIACSLVENWLAAPNSQWLEPDHSHFERVKALLLDVGTGRNLVADAQIAAYGQQYNATICSANSDFRRFDVKWLNPLARR